jgi:hypothetical protein
MVPVQRYLVTAADDLSDEPGKAVDLLSQKEECRVRSCLRESSEHRRSCVLIRPIVESKDCLSAWRHALEPRPTSLSSLPIKPPLVETRPDRPR